MNKYINRPVVGIDVAAEFSMVAILAPDGEVYRKSFRINHTLDGFEYLASEIKKVEEKYDMKVASFMESTGVYHISLFHFLSLMCSLSILLSLILTKISILEK